MEHYHEASRDPARTPFPWDTTNNAGFSTASKTWLPVNSDYITNNVQTQTNAANSHLKIFKKLVKLRKKSVLRQGSYKIELTNDNKVLIMKRQYAHDIAVIIPNFGSISETVNVKETFPEITETTLPVYTASLDANFVDG